MSANWRSIWSMRGLGRFDCSGLWSPTWTHPGQNCRYCIYSKIGHWFCAPHGTRTIRQSKWALAWKRADRSIVVHEKCSRKFSKTFENFVSRLWVPLGTPLPTQLIHTARRDETQTRQLCGDDTGGSVSMQCDESTKSARLYFFSLLILTHS